MRKTALSLTAATAIAASAVVSPVATAAEPAAGIDQLSSNAPQLIENAGPFGLLAVMGGSVLAIYAVLSVLGGAVS